MSQYILLNSYFGCSDYTFNVECSGRYLDKNEVLSQKLVTSDQLRRHKESDYTKEWYEVNPSDTITVEHFYDDEPQINRKRIFRVPQSGMPSPNTNLDNLNATGADLENHLIEQCELIKEEKFR